MALDLRLQQKMVQQLVMTPQLQQAIKLLQLSHLEMAEVLREEVEKNPVLEERGEGGDDDGGRGDVHEIPTGGEATAEPAGASNADASHAEGETSDRFDGGEEGGNPTTSEVETAADLATVTLDAPLDATPEPSSRDVDKEIDWESYLDTYSYSLPASAGAGISGEELPSYEATVSKPTGLLDHLRWQVHMASLSEDETAIAMMLLEEINDDGYLAPDAVRTVADELGLTEDDVGKVLAELQKFDPPGVAARDLRECLLIQVELLAQESPLATAIIDRHLHHVERRNYNAIAKALKTTVRDVADAVKLISGLEPRPGRLYSDKPPQYIVPDIYVHKVGDDYVIVLNEDGLPRLRISNYYRNALTGSGAQAKTYIQERLRSAAWLIRSIHMRQRTIYRVVESILQFQRAFFDQGVASLKPLILKDVAEHLQMHESTISRVTTNKYVHTPQGIFELKYFFNSSINRVGGESIASESVRDHIKRLIDGEDLRTPLSDQKIVELLKQHDIDIARRTVAKYREMLKIPSSAKRKRVF